MFINNPNHGRGPWCTCCRIEHEQKNDSHLFKLIYGDRAILLVELDDLRRGDPICSKCAAGKILEWMRARMAKSI